MRQNASSEKRHINVPECYSLVRRVKFKHTLTLYILITPIKALISRTTLKTKFMKLKNYALGQWIEGEGDGEVLHHAITGELYHYHK